MPWTTPPTYTTGQLITAALANQQWRDNENLLATCIDTSTGAILSPLRGTFIGDAAGVGLAIRGRAADDIGALLFYDNAGTTTKSIIYSWPTIGTRIQNLIAESIYLETNGHAWRMFPSGGLSIDSTDPGTNGLRVTGVTDLAGYKETETALAIASNVLTVNMALGSFVNWTMNANITTTTISNVPASGRAASFVARIVSNGSAFTWAWFTSTVLWPGGTVPTRTSANGKTDLYQFYTPNAGATWYGFVLGQNF